MTEGADITSFRRILVAVDTSMHSRAALNAAIALAQIVEADVRGLFVRDTKWYHISRLPFISEISELTGEVRPLPEQTMKKQIRLLEQRIQHMARLIERYSDVSYSWKSVTGSVTDQILEASEEADLIALGRIGHSFSEQKTLGKLARAVIDRSDKPVLILQRGLTLGNTILAVYDASEQSQRGLKTALALAERTEKDLIVLILKNDPQGLKERDKTVEELLERADIEIGVTFISQPQLWTFTRLLNRYSYGMLIIPENQPLVTQHSVGTLITLLNRPILLMN